MKEMRVPERVNEFAARSAGHRTIIGVDESGVGAIAGPLVAAAVVLPQEWSESASDAKSIVRHKRRAACTRVHR